MNLSEIQESIQEAHMDGWLFCDIYKRDKISYKILGLDEKRLVTRRWFYFIPSRGEPVKLVHKIERGMLEALPGRTIDYLGWREMRSKMAEALTGCKRIAMQYSPYNNIPTISYVDAGTVEWIRSLEADVVSSADLVQRFEARVDEKGMALHKEAGEKVQRIKDMAFERAMDAIKSHKPVTEYDLRRFILDQFDRGDLTCEEASPIVAVNAHAADPHFEPTPSNTIPIRQNDRLLIDLWAKANMPEGIYYDITWCGYMGKRPPDEYRHLFDIVVQARAKAKMFITDALGKSQSIFGWQVDQVCRDYITEQGYGDYFIHRTGHSIHTQLHGNGVNMDNLESKDDREIIPGVCFSIEPGIYKGDIGVRSEINVLIDYEGHVLVAGSEQEHLILLH